MSAEEIEMEWSGVRWIDLPVTPSLVGKGMEIHITMPRGVVIVRGFDMAHSHKAIARFLREAADVAEAIEPHMRPISPPSPS